MAGPNKTYPAILGMVGLSLHLSNQTAAREYEKRASKAIQRGALDYSLVSNAKTEKNAWDVGVFRFSVALVNAMDNASYICLSTALIAV